MGINGMVVPLVPHQATKYHWCRKVLANKNRLTGNNKSYLELDEVVASREAVQMVVKIEKEGENKPNESLSVDAIK